MTNRHRGDYFERQTRDALNAYGWLVVRAAGSMGPCDLVALRAGKALLVSCKIKPRLDPGERADLMAAATVAGGRPLLAYRSKPGWVALRTVGMGPSGLIVDTLKVPARVGQDEP